jgi:hypothetical protein
LRTAVPCLDVLENRRRFSDELALAMPDGKVEPFRPRVKTQARRDRPEIDPAVLKRPPSLKVRVVLCCR